ncbi:MAG: MmgE/PrpD family protein, partial [Betaproteobacteria bacterium]|nr:MmgE/PrpD family protein [Betaproteobacteria bacterium]
MLKPDAGPAVAERLADAVIALRQRPLPAALRARAEELLIDVSGLCVAARGNDYMRALIASVDAGGGCTALGHA